MSRRFALLGALILTACAPPEPPPAAPAPTASRVDPVIYGQDDRTDFHAIADPLWRQRAESTAVLVPDDLLTEEGDAITYEAVVYGEHFDLCEGQRFFDQPRLGRCSGTLVDDDVVLTAGHCIPNQARCDDRRFVFGWAVTEPGAPPVLAPDDVYRCAEILLTVDTDLGGQRVDFAFIRLDRPVVGRPVAPLRLADEAFEPGDAVTVIGYPNGLPVKYAPNGAVINPRAMQRDFFEATLDTFGGNSGSGVFDPNGDVVGILVRGERDYVSTDAGCDVVNVIDEARTVEEGAEDVTYVARALEALCLTGHQGPRLCAPGGQGWCFPCAQDGDCRDGWACAATLDNPEVRACAPPCEADADCRADHTCQQGRCLPRLALACSGPDVWSRDACGRWIDPVFVCAPGQRCGGAACEAAPAGDRCGDPLPLEAVDQQVVGDFEAARYGAFESGTCGGAGPEVVFAFTVDVPTAFSAQATGFDTLLHLRAGCAGEEIACVDDSDPPGERGARVEAELPPGEYRLFLDAYGSTVADYTLDLTFTPTGCAVVCRPGDLACEGDSVARCDLVDACPVWTPLEVCGAGLCVEGACQTPPPPEDACETAPTLGTPARLLGTLPGVTDAGDTDVANAACTDALDWHYRLTVDAPTQLLIQPPEGVDLTLRQAACDTPAFASACAGMPLDAHLEAGEWILTVDAPAGWALDLAWTPDVVCPPGCEVGASRCADPRTVEVCETNEAGCARWVAQTCEVPTLCLAGACSGPPDAGPPAADLGVAPDAGAAIPDAGAAADGGGAEATGGSGDGGCDSSGDAPGTGLLGLLVLGLGLIRRR